MSKQDKTVRAMDKKVDQNLILVVLLLENEDLNEGLTWTEYMLFNFCVLNIPICQICS